MEKEKTKPFKFRDTKYRIFNQLLYWKYPRGIEEYEENIIMTELHKGARGGHHY
jgi:hypothetical protein